jgi:hypothetical protein
MFEQMRDGASRAMDRAQGWVREHQAGVRAAANAGIYTLGCVVMYKATTLAGVLVGAAALCVGAVGVSASAAELLAGSAKGPFSPRTAVPNG